MRVVVATHGHCFDGLASATWFTRLFAAIEGPGHDFVYHNCGYGVGQQRASEALLDGDHNALLDFRFAPVESLTWFFDHHRTGFESDADRALFTRRKAAGYRYFFAADYPSCTQLLADTARDQFGITAPELDELVRRATVVDSAQFDSPEHAVDRADPVMRLVTVVEHSGDDGFIRRVVPELLSRPVSEVAQLPEVERRYAPLGARQERFIRRVQQAAELRGRVVFVDLTTGAVELLGKFVTYYLYPEATYSVVVAKLGHGAKISVGYNPWCGKPLDTDISAICSRHGGGGHPVVGGISFAGSDVEHARAVARQIAHELAEGG
jgi:hypothetical protein